MQLLSLAAKRKVRAASLSSVQQAMTKAALSSGSKRLPLNTGSGESVTALPALDVLRVQPVGGMYSRFFGQSEVRPRMTHAVELLHCSNLIPQDASYQQQAFLGNISYYPYAVAQNGLMFARLSDTRLVCDKNRGKELNKKWCSGERDSSHGSKPRALPASTTL